MKILHFSDLHLDAPFGSSLMPAKLAHGCRLRLRRTLLKILDFAVEFEVDAVTVAGDLFEGDRITRDTIHFLSESFAQLAPIPIVIAPGNHDYFSPISAYARHEWPENVTIFKAPQLQSISLSETVRIWGAAHTAPNVTENPLEGFELADETGINLLLLHATVIDHVGEHRAQYMPIRLQDLQSAGFDFALLGHFHGAREIRDEVLRGLYPGSPQPLDFGDQGNHGVGLMTLEPESNRLTYKFIPTATQSFTTLEMGVSGFTDTHALAEAIISQAPQKAAEANFLKVKLTGEQPEALDLQQGLLQEHLNQYYDHVIIENHLQFRGEELDYADEQTVRGRFVKRLQTMLEEEQEDPELIRLALKFGIKAFEEENLVHL